MASKKKAPVVEEPEVQEEEVIKETNEEISDEALLALGAEMNKIMFPDDMIDYDALDSNGLLEQITADAKNIDPADPFSDESKETLAALGIEIKWAAVKPAKGKREKVPKAEKPVKTKTEKPAKPEKSKPTKAKKEAKVKPEKEEKQRYYRSWSFADAVLLKEAKTEDELIELSRKLYKENSGGVDNERQTIDMHAKCCQILTRMGFIEINNKEIKYLF